MEEHNSMIKDFLDAVQFYIDSKRGKYSLETYLKIISEYADKLILESKEMMYIGGECRVRKKIEQEEFLEFYIAMFFRDKDDNEYMKEACRKLSVKKFTKETIRTIGEQEYIYQIDEPERKN